MIEIIGKEPKGFERNEFKKIGDLARTESGEPLICVYSVGEEIDPILWFICETDDSVKRWLVFPIKSEYIEAYLNGEITGAELMISGKGGAFTKEYYILDVGERDIVSALRVHNEDIPAEYSIGMDKFITSSPDEAAIREYLRTLQ